MNDDANWISVSEAKQRLGRGERQLRNYVKQGKLRNRLRGRRLEYYEPDIATIAGELPEDDRQRIPDQSVMPAGEMLNHIRDLERQLNQAMAEVGYLRGQLETQQLQLTEARAAQRLLTDKEREAADLQRQLQQATGTSKQRGWLLIAVIILLVLFIIGIYTGILPVFR